MRAESRGGPLLAFLVGAALMAGCGTGGVRPDAPPDVDARVVRHDDGRLLTPTEAGAELARFRHVYVSERHASRPHQAVQLEVLEALRAAGAGVTVAVEWLPVAAQPTLDRYLAGEIDEATFVVDVDWPRRWGHAFERYAPIFRHARAHGVRVVALNAPPGLPSRYVRQGLEGLSAEDRAAMPPLDSHDPVHRAWFTCLYTAAMSAHGHGHGGHGHGALDPARLEKAYEAQLVWDETMAQGVARLVAGARPGHVVLVLAGQGHIDWGLGIPSRAAAEAGEPFAIVLPAPPSVTADATLRARRGAYPERRGDYLWVPPPEAIDGDAEASILLPDECR